MEVELREGLVQVYTGKGKGKTTAALGLGLRASGHGLKVKMIQFLKGGNYTGELKAIKNLTNFKIDQFGKKCSYSEKIQRGEIECTGCGDCFVTANNRDEHKKFVKEAYQYSKKVLTEAKSDIVILDEINNALEFNFLTNEEVLKLIEHKSAKTELVLTGRGLPAEILAAADLVTEMKKIKHPFTEGISSRRGIEY